MRLTLSRSGGFAGIPRPAVKLDTAQASSTLTKRIQSLLERAGFLSLAADLGPPKQPDRFQYSLNVQMDDGTQHTVSFSEDSASEPLLDLVQLISASGRR